MGIIPFPSTPTFQDILDKYHNEPGICEICGTYGGLYKTRYDEELFKICDNCRHALNFIKKKKKII